MTQKERMEKGLVYFCADNEIMDDQVYALKSYMIIIKHDRRRLKSARLY
jgi:hypothetical protein